MRAFMMFIVAAVAPISLSWAHHSSAMFDAQKVVEISGTVKQWDFVAPHAWLHIMVRQPNGTLEEWSFEGGGPLGSGSAPILAGAAGAMATSRDTFKPGEQVTVRTHPMKDGRHAGELLGVTFSDGRKWGRT